MSYNPWKEYTIGNFPRQPKCLSENIGRMRLPRRDRRTYELPEAREEGPVAEEEEEGKEPRHERVTPGKAGRGCEEAFCREGEGKKEPQARAAKIRKPDKLAPCLVVDGRRTFGNAGWDEFEIDNA